MTRSARILIVSNGPLYRNPRVVKEATTLGAAGHHVTVLTLRNHAPSEPEDVALLRTAPFQRVTVDMLPGYDTGDLRILARRARLWLARKAARFPMLESMQSLGPASALLAAARRQPADLTIVHNEIPHWVGCHLLRDGRRVAADIEDWHSEDLLPTERAGRPLNLIRRVERQLLHEATYVTTTSAALSAALAERYASPAPAVVTNSFPLQPDPHRGAPGEPPAFFWFSQTTGPGRGLEQFCAAWARTTRASRLVLLGELRPGYDRDLLALLPADHRPRVTFLPLVPSRELPGIIARHDLGLALEQPFIRNRDLTITNKILQYFNAGLGVIASPTAGQREALARAPGAGIVASLDAPADLAAQLDALLADPARIAAMGAAARRAAEATYCWEKEAPQLLARVEIALA